MREAGAGVASGADPARASRRIPSLERMLAILERGWPWALAALMSIDTALLLYVGRGLTFFFDDWDYVTHDYGGGIHSLLLPHNGHLSLVPIAIYKLLFHLVGLNHYAVFRLVLIVLHLACAGLVFVLVARRQTRVVALLASSLILFLGAAWEDLIWAFQIDYMLSIAGGLAAWVLLDGRGRRSDILATLAVTVSVASSGLGIPVLAGIVVELALRREWRRWFVVVVPAILYALWYLHYGEDVITHEGLVNAPGFAEDMAAAAFGGLAGHGVDWGRPLALLGVGLLLWRVTRPLAQPARLAGLMATGVVLWLLTAAARATISSPETSRYLYLGGVVIVLTTVELLREVRVDPRVCAGAAAVVAVCVVTGLTLLRDGSADLRGTSKTVTAELGALELAAAYAPPAYQPDQHLAPQIFAGAYLHTVRSIGSTPADSVGALRAADPAARAAADAVLIALERPILLGAAGPPGSVAPSVVSASAGSAVTRGACVTISPSGGTVATVVLALPPGGVLLRDRGASATAAIKRFGDSFVPLAGFVGASASLTLPADAARGTPWELQLSSSAPLVACGA